MDYFEELSSIIKNTLNDKNFYYELKYLDEIEKLAKIVVDNTPKLKIKKYSNYVPLNESIINVIDFFDSFNKDYSNYFQNILREKQDDLNISRYSFNFNKRKEEHILGNSESRINGSVYINYSETLSDTYALVHEVTHKFSQPKNQNSTIKSFFGEASSIVMEFLMQDYLLNNKDYDLKEIIKEKEIRLFMTELTAENFIITNELIKLYKENNTITKDIFSKYLNGLNKNSNIFKVFMKSGTPFLEDILKSKTLNITLLERYLLGPVVASNIHEKIKNDPKNINILFDLVDIFSHTDITILEDLQKLESLDIEVIKNHEIDIDVITKKRLTKSYKKEVYDLLKNKTKGFFHIR